MRLPAPGRSRTFLLLSVLVVVVAAAAGAWLLTRGGSAAAAPLTATVSRETIQQTVSVEGTVAARRTEAESFAVSGTVTRVAVQAGDTVTKGEVLATVDATTLRATREAAASSLEAALTQLDEDEDSGASDVQVAADEAAVVSARASLAEARQAVEDATLRASMTGTVTEVGIAKADVVGSGSSSSTAGGGAGATETDSADGTITIVSTGHFVVDATVAAQDAEQLKKGLQAEVTVTGVDDVVYGTVSEVGLVAETNSSGAAVFPVTIAVTGTRDDLYAGVAATASVIVKQVPDVLTVASRALSTEDGTTTVTQIVDGEEVETEVETGETYGMTTEIVSGLDEGDVVVVPGFSVPSGGGGGQQEEGGFPGGEMPDFGQMPNGSMPGGQPQSGGQGQ